MRSKRKFFCVILLIIVYMCSFYLHNSFEKEYDTWSNKRTTVSFSQDKRIYHIYNQNEKEKTKDLELYARSAALMDALNGRILFSKNGTKQMAMASTTKIMTCIVLLENGNLEDVVTFSENAARQPDVQLNACTGEKFIFKDLLYALMLESYNDVAVALAEHVGGSVEGFAKMMNQKAKELNCTQTNFVTPNGLDAKNHYSSSIDLCKIAAYAIEDKRFLEITNTMTHSFQEISKGKTFTVSNHNTFLTMYKGAIGVKTGFTCDAGYCFVGAVKNADHTLVSAVLACGWPPNKQYKWADTKKIMDYGCEAYKNDVIFPNDIKLPYIPVANGQKTKLKLGKITNNIQLLTNGTEARQILLELPPQLYAPIVADTQIGTIYYVFDNAIIKEQPIYATENIEKITFYQILSELFCTWTL